MSDKKAENSVVYKPMVEEKKPVSFIWIIPLIILGILSWIAYESYMKKGTNIVVVFKSAEGLKEGVTPLEYKGLQLGKVTKVDINNDLKNVKVNILVRNEAAKYVANDSSRFWIRKPTISLTKISGLSTLISGYKIELSPKYKTKEAFEKAKEKLVFQGLDSKPNDDFIDSGYYITLISNQDDNVQIGTPIFYNNFQVGEVYSKEFRFEKIFIKAYIYDKFNYLINKSSKFYMNDALKVSYGASGLKIEVGSLYSSLVGGITVSTPNKDEPKIHKDEVYILYPSKEELRKREYFTLSFLDASGIAEDTPIIYKGITIGKIIELKLNQNDVETKAFVYEKYKHLLSENSKFYVEETQINFDGVKNLGNIVKGNYISLDYKKGKFKNSFKIDKYLNEMDKKFDKTVTLYTDDLNSINKNSKVYYKNFEIGKVTNIALTKDFKKLEVKVTIQRKYRKLINDTTLFYDISSKLLELKGLDLNINYEGFEPLLNGGIAIVPLKTKHKLTKKSFKLYNSYKDIEKIKRTYKTGNFIDAYFHNDFKIKKNMAVVYKNQQIGFVDSIKFGENRSKVRLFIYTKYKKYLNKKSRFYKQKLFDAKMSLNGILFEVDNFTSFLEGSIHLENSAKKNQNLYNIFASYDELKNSSQSISILFDDVEGLHEQFSQLTYKGVKIGKVTKVSLTKENKVLVKAQIYDKYDEFTKDATIYYLKKPKISFQEIKNLGSTVMAVNIGVIKSSSKKVKNSFVGYNSLPSIEHTQFGTIFKIESEHASDVKESAPIYYKKVKIGKVHKIGLTPDASKMLIDCLIEDKYTKLVRKNSKFYDISGFNMEVSLFSETKVEASTFTSIMKGGLILVTPMDYNEKASVKDRFLLIDELPKEWDKISPSIK